MIVIDFRLDHEAPKTHIEEWKHKHHYRYNIVKRELIKEEIKVREMVW